MNQFMLLISTFLLLSYSEYHQNHNNFEKVILAPQNVNASDGSFPGKINITWDKVQSDRDIVYLIYRGESPALEDMQLIKAPLSKKNHAVDRYQLIPDKRYFYCVKAGYDSQNVSPFSDVDSGFIRNIATPPTDSLGIPIDSTLIKRDTIIQD